MQASTLAGHTIKKDGLFVVDVDVHIHETPAALAPYCEMPWRKTLEHLATVPARYLDIPGFAPNIGLWPTFPQGGGDRRNTVTSAAQMRQDLDDLGVDVGIWWYADHPSHYRGDGLPATVEKGNFWLDARARGLADVCSYSLNRSARGFAQPDGRQHVTGEVGI